MAFTQSFRRIESQLLPRRVEVEGCLGYLEYSIQIPAVSSLSPSAHELSLSSSIDLSSIKQSGESSYSRIGVRGLGVDNLEEGQLDFYNTHRRVTFGRNQGDQSTNTWPTPTPWFQGSRFSQMFAGKEMKIVCRLKHTWVSDSLYLACPRVYLWTLGVAPACERISIQVSTAYLTM